MTPEEFEVKQKEIMMRKESEPVTEKSEPGTESVLSENFSDQTDQIVADDHQTEITEEKVGSSQPFAESVSSNSHSHADEIIVAKNDLNCKDAGSIAENSAGNDVLSGSKYEEAGSIQDEETDESEDEEIKNEEITNIEKERTETDRIETNDGSELKIFGVRRNWMEIGATNGNVPTDRNIEEMLFGDSSARFTTTIFTYINNITIHDHRHVLLQLFIRCSSEICFI